MSRTADGTRFNVGKSELQALTQHDNEDVALAAEIVYKHRYDEEPP